MSTDALQVARPPVILLGMHRSGTSLIARLLDDLGLFQGASLQDDHESTYFLEVNDLLLKRIGATWDHPNPMREFLQQPAALELTLQCVRADLRSKAVSGYLGLKQYLTCGSLEKLDRAWGWKDPRSVFTLPLWLRLFPGAKLLYIVRNGVDVASSLRVREQRELARRIEELPGKAKQRAGHSLLERAGFKGSARCLSLAGAFSLWEEYVTQAEAALAATANEGLVIRYERFLSDPRDATHGLARVARFCGMDADAAKVEQALAQIKPERAKAFLSDPELSAFYQTVKETPWMKRYGYDNL